MKNFWLKSLWVFKEFFLKEPLRAGLMSPIPATVHPKVSLCATLCGRGTQEKEKEQQTTMGSGRLEDARKEWKSCGLEERERSTHTESK